MSLIANAGKALPFITTIPLLECLCNTQQKAKSASSCLCHPLSVWQKKKKKKRQLQTTDKKDPVACPGPLLQQQRAERMGVVGCKKGVSMACYVGWQAHHRYIGYQPTRSYHQRGRKSDKCKQPTAPRPSNVRQFLKQAASCDLVAYNTYLILSGC